ncbi:MAG: hypothetical protein M1426_03045 [Patescibacteria group bacterium]|nr:hypothetical protein [Patescibacteria group bacterium]
MSIIETDINTGDASMWDARIKRARQNRTPLPSLQDISPLGSLYQKTVRYTGEDEDRLMVEVVVNRVDDEGKIIPGAEQPIEEPDVLFKSRISEAGIRVGSTVISWQPTPEI